MQEEGLEIIRTKSEALVKCLIVSAQARDFKDLNQVGGDKKGPFG